MRMRMLVVLVAGGGRCVPAGWQRGRRRRGEGGRLGTAGLGLFFFFWPRPWPRLWTDRQRPPGGLLRMRAMAAVVSSLPWSAGRGGRGGEGPRVVW